MLFQRIRDLREDHELSQAAVAKILNVSQRTYSYYETDGINLSAESVKTLAQYYNVSADYILGLINKPRNLCDE